MMPTPPPHGKSSLMRVEIPARVLVVDDEPLIRWSICSALTSAGYDAVPAADFDEAQRLSAEWPPPRVAIVDRRFTVGDEQDLLAFIQRVYPACRFLIMSTAERGTGTIGPSSDRIEVIEKPFDLARVVRLVADLAEAA